MLLQLLVSSPDLLHFFPCLTKAPIQSANLIDALKPLLKGLAMLVKLLPVQGIHRGSFPKPKT